MMGNDGMFICLSSIVNFSTFDKTHKTTNFTKTFFFSSNAYTDLLCAYKHHHELRLEP